MKFARISMACLMLMAIIFKSLPDSVFNYFHTHSHVSSDDLNTQAGHSFGDYQHNCQIEDWNYESFEVTENNFQPVIATSGFQMTIDEYALTISVFVSAIGRAPPIA